MSGKLGKTAEQRLAILRNQASELLWYGRITTTHARAKELQPYVEKIITKAIRVYDLNEETEVVTTDKKGKEIKSKVIKDSPKKTCCTPCDYGQASRFAGSQGFQRKEVRLQEENGRYKAPLMEKLFNEIAPKYAQRAEELGQGGGYTRIYLLGTRKGDNAEEAIIELV